MFNSVILHTPDVQEAFHWHGLPEILYQITGHTTVTVEKEHFELHAQDIIIVNPFTIHSHVQNHGHLLQLQIDMTYLIHTLGISTNLYFSCNSTRDDGLDYTFLRRALTQFEYLYLKNTSSHSLKAAEFQIIALIFDAFSTPDHTTPSTPALSHLQTAITYIDAHYHEPVSVNSIARFCHLSETHLAHLFQQKLKTTPSTYLTSVRVRHAAALLKDTNLSLSEIAIRSGFGEPRKLNAAFRAQYQMLPRNWRTFAQAWPEQTHTPAATDNELLEHLLTNQAFQSMPEIRSEIQDVDIRKTAGSIPDTIFQMLCAGHFSALLEKSYCEQIRVYQKHFQHKEALVLNPFVPEILPAIQSMDGFVWNFSFIDEIIDFLLSLELKPVIAIGSIPAVLSGNSNFHFATANYAFPDNMDQWIKLLTDFFTHLTDRYGSDLLRSWKCSVWTLQASINEQFLTFYFQTIRHIKEICPAISLGSPYIEITNSANGLDWLKLFIEFCTREHYKPDYYLLYAYPTRTCEVPSGQTYSDVLLQNSNKHIHEALNEIRRYSTKPVYFSWNSSHAGCGDLFNDTTYKSSNLIPMILDMAHSDATAIAYNVPIESATFHSQSGCFTGHFGLITHQGLHKSSYYAFDFLHQLRGDILLESRNVIIVKEHAKIKILCWNHQSIPYRIRRESSGMNSLNALRNPVVLQVDTDRPLWPDPQNRHPMLDRTQLQIKLKLCYLKRQYYRLTELLVNEENGCVYNNWATMGAPDLRTPADIEYLDRISIPKRNVRTIHVSNEYMLCHTLKPTEIYLACLEPVEK